MTSSDSTLPTFLHVGCGPKRKDATPFAGKDWNELRLDIDERVKPDFIGSMTDMKSVLSDSVEAVYSSHNIEHLYPHEVPIALAEFRRVLKASGCLVITCPDLQPVCELVAKDKLADAAYQSGMGPITPLDILYGHRTSMKAGNLYMAHRCGFTKSVLAATLQHSGFSALVASYPSQFALWSVAVLGDASSDDLKKLAHDFLP